MARNPVAPAIHIQSLHSGTIRLYYLNILVAVVQPPRPWDLPDQWRALDAEGRAVEVNGPDAAQRRAHAWATQLAVKIAAAPEIPADDDRSKSVPT